MNTVESIKHLFLAAGAGWVLWLLASLSVASLAIALERWFFYRRAAGSLHELAAGLHEQLAAHGEFKAAQWLDASNTVAARVAAAGLRLAERGPGAASKAMMSRTALEREDLDRRLAFLGTLGNNAPFIGLFGTVIGVIQAFEELGHSAAGHAGVGATSQVASGAVMSAIAEALVATAVGIAVALPAVAAYNYLQRRVEHVLAGVEVLSNLVLAYLEGDELAAPPESADREPERSPAAPIVSVVARR
ncbi:MAG: MotA/TolQ/ExbB proton channel family protein [Deltaproteobacteria bacterium]|nr:MotA/TolQ/ExbB proton channel family protein [Deltaproteobacteria bacterium]